MEYDPNHSEQLMSMMAPSLATPMLQDILNDPRSYQGQGWVNVVQQADKYRQMGGMDLAEKQYLVIVANLRKVRGPASNDLSLALDHLAEFYLDERRFDDAYKTFSEAVEVQRHALDAMKPTQTIIPPTPAVQQAAAAARNAQIHLSDLLTRLGQLDFAKKDYASAGKRFAEAVTIVNMPENIRYTDGLYAIYFQSRVWEQQGNWKAADDLWHAAAKAREAIDTTRVYWDVQREMAAFYARHGDFQTAAGIVQNITTGTAGKRIQLQGHS
jgi:tetratricopeptide (TPR) repeat protein